MPRVRRIGIKNIVLPLTVEQKDRIEREAERSYRSQQSIVIERVQQAVEARRPLGDWPERLAFGTPNRRSLYIELPSRLFSEVSKILGSDRPIDVSYYAVQAVLNPVKPEPVSRSKTP